LNLRNLCNLRINVDAEGQPIGIGDDLVMNALPIIIGTLCVMAIAYRYYSAFIAARVLALDDSGHGDSLT